MDAAIHQLGCGNYAHDIAINGPGDLRQLGVRLNWLRIALKDLHQKKQRFLQQASHELKTPLTAIREASELLNDGVAGKLNQQQGEVVHILRENSLRLQKMIENLLNYTEIQFNASENKFNLSTVKLIQQPLNVLVKDILLAYDLTIAYKKITMRTSIDEIIMLVDLEKLRTVLDNLISNAVKFTPDNGEISIRASQSKNIVTIAIRDTGAGISEANTTGLFEPFYRGEQPNNSLVTGSGLGLFIAKEVVNALNGEISLVSAQAGMHVQRGAHFIIRLPVSQQAF